MPAEETPMTTTTLDPKARDLAERIYADLLREAVKVSDNGVHVTTDPKNLAKISFKLATAFRVVEDELNAENLPKNQDFKLDISDMVAWSKTP
jgi:hypothetical protein